MSSLIQLIWTLQHSLVGSVYWAVILQISSIFSFLSSNRTWPRAYLSLFRIIRYLSPSSGLPVFWNFQIEEAYCRTKHVTVVSVTEGGSVPATVRDSRCSLIAQPHYLSLSAHTQSQPSYGQNTRVTVQSTAVSGTHAHTHTHTHRHTHIHILRERSNVLYKYIYIYIWESGRLSFIYIYFFFNSSLTPMEEAELPPTPSTQNNGYLK